MSEGSPPGHHPVPSYPSCAKMDVFNHPDSDDPVAQTLYRMIEPDDKVSESESVTH